MEEKQKILPSCIRLGLSSFWVAGGHRPPSHMPCDPCTEPCNLHPQPHRMACWHTVQALWPIIFPCADVPCSSPPSLPPSPKLWGRWLLLCCTALHLHAAQDPQVPLRPSSHRVPQPCEPCHAAPPPEAGQTAEAGGGGWTQGLWQQQESRGSDAWTRSLGVTH